jgi:protein gp37
MQTTIEWTARRLAFDADLWHRCETLKFGHRTDDGSLVLPGFTFNPWRGCVEISPACDHCYAREQAKRNPETLGRWGPGGYRAMAAESYWNAPRKWNALAEKLGVELNVFCLSLGDVFEDHPDLIAPRARLLDVIRQTPWLRWLLLTKRPENFRSQLAAASACASENGHWQLSTWIACWHNGVAPANVRMGITAERQVELNARLPHLLRIPAPGYFISAEPLLGPLDLDASELGRHRAELQGRVRIITGGESGNDLKDQFGQVIQRVRPSHPAWFSRLMDEAALLGQPFFFKQWGDWAPRCGNCYGTTNWSVEDPECRRWPSIRLTITGHDSRTGEALVPGAGEIDFDEDFFVQRVGKVRAGRLLYGREHNGDLAVPNGRGL